MAKTGHTTSKQVQDRLAEQALKNQERADRLQAARQLKQGEELPLNEGIPEQETPPAAVAPVETAKTAVTGTYKVPKGEEGLFHVELEQIQWDVSSDPSKPRKMSTPFVQKFTPRDYANFKEHQKSTGFTVNKVMHEPASKK